MPRAALHTDDVKIDQRPEVPNDPRDREPEVIEAGERVLKDNVEWLDELKFNEEWVTIRLEPSPDKNAATSMYVAVNGKGCEVLLDGGQIVEMAYVPVGMILTVKRKYVAVIVNAKIDTITTAVDEPGASDFVKNEHKRFTSPVHSFAVLEDRNPAGQAWLSALRRRNM